MILKNVKISEELHTMLRLTAIHRKQNLQQVLNDILKDWYRSRKEIK